MIIRVTGVLLKDDKILLIEQVAQGRSWSLPGGTLEEGETLEAALIREMLEETGLKIEIKELLYICDFIHPEKHVLHITFSLELISGNFSNRDKFIDTQEIRSVKFVSIKELTKYGFSKKFQQIVTGGFPNRGHYMGDKANIGL